MTPEFYAVIGSAMALAGLILNGQRSVAEMRRDIADLRERMARLEGLFEGFTKRPHEANTS
jgi:hypothetical protein